MAITDHKISEAFSNRDVSSLSDRPNESGLTGAQLKARFDQLGKEVIPKYNDLIDELNDTVLPAKVDVEAGKELIPSATLTDLTDGTDTTLHTHDGRYYTETEVDGLLLGKSSTTHNHDTVYAPIVHTHDDRYFTEAETTALLGGKVDKETGKSLVLDTLITDLSDGNDSSAHYHSADRNTDNHTDGTTNKVYSATDKLKLAGIEAGAEVNNISDVNATDLTDGGDTNLHTHDSRYYTETEMNALLNAKQATLVSGTNIKTVNSNSLLGSGDVLLNATSIPNTPAGNISAVTVQAAINELDTEKQPNALIATYTHSGNREVFVSAIDVDTNTFTSVAHGLSNGNNVYPVFEDDLGATFAALVLPGGLQALKTYPGYYVVNKTDNTFQLSLTNGGAAIDITTNASLDLTKWHFEAGDGADLISITGLPSGLRRLRIVHRGRTKRPNSPGHISINNIDPNTNVWLYGGTIGGPISAYLGNIFHNVETIIETRGFMYVRHIGYKWDQNTTSANTGTEIRIHEASTNPSVCNVDISTVNIYNVGLANGATIEVYRV